MKPFACHFPNCNSSYLRKEHLQRHLVQHTADTRTSPCPFCNRVFGRQYGLRADHSSDTMRRHARQAHKAEPKRLCDVRAERTCRTCWVASSSCEGQRPCRRCLREGLRCSFSDDRASLPRPNIDSTSSILRYTQRYFEHFHPQWPFLHQSTYSVRDEPSILLYSVVAIGLWTEGSASSRATALALHGKIGNSIYQQKVGTRPFYITI